MQLSFKQALFLFIVILGIALTKSSWAQENTATPQNLSETKTLNLDAISNSSNESRLNPGDTQRALIGSVGAIILMLFAIGLAYRIGAKDHLTDLAISINSFPVSAKLVVTFLVSIFALTHGIALITVYLQTHIINGSTYEYFSNLKLARLTALSHAHIMGIGIMDGVIALIYSLSRKSSGFSCAVVAAAFFGVFGDIGSWWLIKYYGASFEYFSIASGLLCAAADVFMTLAICLSLWKNSSLNFNDGRIS